MILEALNEHYYRLLDDPESGVAPPGYSPAKVSHAMLLSAEGILLDFFALSTQEGKKSRPKILLVPEQIKKTSGIAANLLCENPAYLMGLEINRKTGETESAALKFEKFKEENLNLVNNLSGKSALAFKKYLNNWNPTEAQNNPVLSGRLDEISSTNSVAIMIDGVPGYLHDDKEIRYQWEKEQQRRENEADDYNAQCLVTGDVETIARLHPGIKNVVGAQTSGASLVSFNIDSFTSYNKSQSYNAPVSKKASFAYATALNYLTANDMNRVRLADTTMVFWADKKGGKKEEAVLSWLIDPIEVESDEDVKEEKRRLDPAAVFQAKTILNQIKAGLPVGDTTLDPETRCYLLGLAPNAARLSVRFWQISSFGDILRKIAQHYLDMEIVGLEQNTSSWKVLKAIAIQEDSKNIPPLLGGQLMRSIITGKMYPQTLYNSVLIRCRGGGEHNGVTPIRAAIIKAFLVRKYRINNMIEKEALITLSLNENNTQTAYLLGRLFSLLEKVQKDALGKNINATIRDRYFGAASATPGSVFPLLLRLSRHHISKSQYGNLSDRNIQNVLNMVSQFPTHFNLEEQGQFILGYYHQNEANYKKSGDQNMKEEVEND